MRVSDLRARHIKGIIENGSININGITKQASPNTKSRIKSLFNLMLDYAVEYEIVNINYARTFNLSKGIMTDIENGKVDHIIFTPEELAKLWVNRDKYQCIDIIIFQCYTGFRPQELGLLKISNIDLNNWTIIGGMKTEAGTNRLVPIHSFVKEIVLENINKAKVLHSEYLFNVTNSKTHRDSIKLTYDKYNKRFEEVIKELGLNPMHRPHDPRKTFISMAKNSGVNEYAIKKIVGHKISDLTEAVYTTRPDDWLFKEMKKK